MTRTQFLLPTDVYNQLKLEAAIQETSMSHLVVDSIKKHIMVNKKMTGQEFLKYLAKNAKRGVKTPRDLSTNDNYLYSKKAHYGFY